MAASRRQSVTIVHITALTKLGHSGGRATFPDGDHGPLPHPDAPTSHLVESKRINKGIVFSKRKDHGMPL